MSRSIQFSVNEYTTKVYPKNEFGEYRVRLFIDGRKYPPADYFTNDKSDAVETAKVMLQRIKVQGFATVHGFF